MTAGVLIALVSISSYRRIRNRMHYETWYYLHLLGYLAVALALGQSGHRRLGLLGQSGGHGIWWLALYAAVARGHRLGCIRPLVGSLLRPMKVIGIDRAAPDSFNVWVAGTRACRACRPARVGSSNSGSGPRTCGGSTIPIPCLRSLRPGPAVRISQHRRRRPRLRSAFRVGTRVWLEGPLWHLHGGTLRWRSGAASRAAAASRPAGNPGGSAAGSALKSSFGCGGRGRLVYAELTQPVTALEEAASSGYGEPGGTAWTGPVRREALLAAVVPDLTRQVAFICGPTGMTRAAMKGLAAAGMPKANIHSERFDY